MIRVINLGAGVQSSTMALMASKGEIRDVRGAIFADTGAEPIAVYRWLDWLEQQLPFPVWRVSAGNITDDVLRIAKSVQSGEVVKGSSGSPPFFTADRGMLFRDCTRDYKINPITKKARELAKQENGGKIPKGTVCIEHLIGISLDEAHRMKPSKLAWSRHRWPLIEKDMTRLHCLEWMQKNNYPTPPRSACVFCPYHSDEEWKRVKDSPKDWEVAVKVDEAIRDGLRGTNKKLYVHVSRTPLKEADLRTAKDAGQLELWGEECEGMCGL